MKSKISLLAITAFATLLVLSACKSSKETAGGVDKSPSLLTFDNGGKVTKDEFEYVYQKNNGGWDSARKQTADQYRDYLKLYINFKRKVMEAESLKLQDADAFKQEFEGYRKQLAQPYLVEQKVQDNLIREAYERSQFTVKASHILVNCPIDASPDDTLKAWKTVNAYRDSIVKGGKSFDYMAENYSQDPSAKKNLGNLGYFTAFDMVYPFETGAYNTQIGQVSQPIRTGYGYHLIKVDDRFKSSGKKTASHIIVRVGPQYSAKDSLEAVQKINEIYSKLEGGADFAELATKFSDDAVTARKGGDLGTGRLIPEMEEVKMRLTKGAYSQPFKTNYGWHILMVTQEDPVKSFEDSKSELKNRVTRDARATISREALIKRVKNEYGFRQNPDAAAKINAAIDDLNRYSKGFWRPVDSVNGAIYPVEVYSMGSGDDKQTGTIRGFFDFYATYRKGVDASTIQQVTEKLLDAYFESEILKFEEKQLPKKYRDYRELVKEYRDGILLFTITEDKVWRKAVEDTAGLRAFWENNRDKFRAGDRVTTIEYQTDNRDNMIRTLDMLKAGKSIEEIGKEINASSPLNLKWRTVTFEKGKTTPEVELFGKPSGYRSEIVNAGSVFRVHEVVSTTPAGPKTFDESKSEAITQYQDFLEKEWLKELETKYPVKVDDNVLKTLFK